jgi:hypothetical protein
MRAVSINYRDLAIERGKQDAKGRRLKTRRFTKGDVLVRAPSKLSTGTRSPNGTLSGGLDIFDGLFFRGVFRLFG